MEDLINNFHFIRAYWLWLFIPLILGVWLWRHRKVHSQSWQSVCDKKLLPFILSDNQESNRYQSSLILSLIGAFCILAMAGPTWKKLPQPVFREQSALVIALDLSRSMDVADIKPSRLARARLKVIDILNKRREGQTALLVYADEAFAVSPLTEDSKTIESMVNSLSTDLMPSQGSRPDKAIKKAEEMLKQAGANSGNILLITDGIPENYIVEEVVPKQPLNKLSVLGIGTEDGAPIPIRNGSFLKDSKGAIVVPKLKEQQLRQLASQGGGRYSRLLVDDSDINYLVADIDRAVNNINLQSEDELKLTTDIWQEEGPWLLLLVIPFVAFAFRKGVIAVLVVLCLPIPTPSYAFEWQELWSRPDQRAAASFKKGEHGKAASEFENEEWAAAAYYKNEDFENALGKLQNVQSADGLYNKGNALAKLGKIPEAIQAYGEALDLSPEHEDAKTNKKLLEDLMQKQDQEQNGSDDQESESDESKSDSESDQPQSDQDSEKQSSQSSEKDGQQESQSKDSNDDAQESDKNENQSSEEQKEADSEEAKEAMQEDKNQSQGAKDKNNQQQAEMSPEQQQNAEMLKANEQWLKRIPDDPGGLLRRKFRYQSKIRKNSKSKEQSQW